MWSRIITTLFILVLILPTIARVDAASVIVGQRIISDFTAPSVPQNLAVAPVASSQIDLTWNASTDDVAVTGYEVWRNGTLDATITAPTTSFSDTGLTAATLYTYIVRAFDAAGNYSGFSTSSATTTLALPTPPATTTPLGGGKGQVFFTKSSFNVTARAFDTRIGLSLSALDPFIATVTWGTTHDGELGTISIDTYKRSHDTMIIGLQPSTTYTIRVVGTNPDGLVIEKTIIVTTKETNVDNVAPANPENFTGTPLLKGVQLSWNNPTDSDFDSVRITRMEGTVPVDPYDGVIVYEGPREGFLDTSVTNGAIYGYAIFARDHSGNFSSGAVAIVRAYDFNTIGDSGFVIFPREGTSTETNRFAKDIVITQGGTIVEHNDTRFTITNDSPFDISVPVGTFPHILKTILVTLARPNDSKKTFTFLLRIDDARTHYTARIGTLKEIGDYTATISVLNLKSQTIMSDSFTLAVTEGKQVGTARTISPLEKLIARLLLIGLLILLFIYAMRRMYLLGKRDGEKGTHPNNNEN